jgi:hypothetical protein
MVSLYEKKGNRTDDATPRLPEDFLFWCMDDNASAAPIEIKIHKFEVKLPEKKPGHAGCTLRQKKN